MKLLLYAGPGHIGEQFVQRIHSLIPEESVETCRTVDNFIKRLRKPVSDLTLTVILAESHEEFTEIIAAGDLLKQIKIILIVPDRTPRTISEAHKLYPRLISFADGDFSDVDAVIGHLLEKTSPFHSPLA